MLFHHDSSAAPQTVQTALPVCGIDGKLSSVELGIIPFLVFPCQPSECLAIHSAACCSVAKPFRLAIGPKNIDHPTKSGITFSRHESRSVFGHLSNMRLRRAGSSRSSDNNYMTVSEPQALEGDRPRQTRASRQASPAAQALRSDVVQRTASRGGTCDAPRRVALPT